MNPNIAYSPLSSGPVGPAPAPLAQVLSSRSSVRRAHSEILAEKIIYLLEAGANFLGHIQYPVLKAQVATLVLDQLANTITSELKAAQLGQFWNKLLSSKTRGAVEAIQAAFNLHGEVLRGLRVEDPNFLFKYLLYSELFRGRLPVPCCDLKDTLAVFTDGKNNGRSETFRGVRESIESLLRTGPFFIITGDTHDTVVEKFLLPNKWVRRQEESLFPASVHAQNLFWLPRTGMDVVRYNSAQGVFERSLLVGGIKDEHVGPLRELLGQVFREHEVADFFGARSRSYEHLDGFPPGYIEVRGGNEPNDASISFFPPGKLKDTARGRFRADAENPVFLHGLVGRINDCMHRMGLDYIEAKRGGLSTIDLVTSDKGRALEFARQQFLGQQVVLVFIGDRIASGGNDLEAASVADTSVQVGYEWDNDLLPEGAHMLVRSKRVAAEGGTAEFLRTINQVRRIGLTHILTPKYFEHDSAASMPEHGKTNRWPGASLNLPRAIERDLQEISKIKKALLTPALDTSDPATAALARNMREAVTRCAEDRELASKRADVQLNIALLRRVCAGQMPVLACDLKDTLGVFDNRSFDWYKGVQPAFLSSISAGPVCLMTGDGLNSLTKNFLLKTGMARSSGPTEEMVLAVQPSLMNLYIVTRTGLDLSRFTDMNQALERTGLVSGIKSDHESQVRAVLEDATRCFNCAQTFSAYHNIENRGPGFVDIRGKEYGRDALSFAYYPAGVLVRDERARFRAEFTDSTYFRQLTDYIRNQLRAAGLQYVLVQQGGISTLDLTTGTKGVALANFKRTILPTGCFVVYIGDTVTTNGNDGSTIGTAEITVQVGPERDNAIAPPPGHMHIHEGAASSGATARTINSVLQARCLAMLRIWSPK